MTPDASSVAVVSTRGVDLLDARTGRLRLALETREGTPASRFAFARDGAIWVQPVAATRSPQFLAAQESAAWRQPTSLGGEAAPRVEVFSLDRR